MIQLNKYLEIFKESSNISKDIVLLNNFLELYAETYYRINKSNKDTKSMYQKFKIICDNNGVKYNSKDMKNLKAYIRLRNNLIHNTTKIELYNNKLQESKLDIIEFLYNNEYLISNELNTEHLDYLLGLHPNNETQPTHHIISLRTFKILQNKLHYYVEEFTNFIKCGNEIVGEKRGKEYYLFYSIYKSLDIENL